MTEELKIDNDQATKEMLENNEYKIIFINYKFIGDFIRRHKLKEQLLFLHL